MQHIAALQKNAIWRETFLVTCHLHLKGKRSHVTQPQECSLLKVPTFTMWEFQRRVCSNQMT